MSTEIAIAPNSSPVSLPKEKKALSVTGKNRVAIDAMVHDGANRKQAASIAGITEKALYKALCKPHVKQYYNAQLEVLRTSARARNFHRLEEIRDQDENLTAAVHAIKTLEGEGSSRSTINMGVSVHLTPGIMVDISERPAELAPIDGTIIEVNPSAEPRIDPRSMQADHASDGNNERN